jgi:hypothetical protein
VLGKRVPLSIVRLAPHVNVFQLPARISHCYRPFNSSPNNIVSLTLSSRVSDRGYKFDCLLAEISQGTFGGVIG